MAQLEYGDYYKFIASAGIALIAGAVLVPWMFLREPFDLAIDASKIALLTPDAQNIVHARQHLIATTISYLPLASGLMATLGTVLTGTGLYQWRSRQSVRDKTEDLQSAKLDKEFQAMSQEQIETKAKNDFKDAEDLEPSPRAIQSASAVGSVLAVEQALIGRISACLGPSHRVTSNQRLGNVEYDAIIKVKSAHRIIVEIKYLRKGFNRGWLSETVNSLAARMALYTKIFDESTNGLLLVVIATSNSPLSGKVMEISKELRISDPSRLESIRIHTIYEADIATIPCPELMKMVLGDPE
jgi:hypothetical protein